MGGKITFIIKWRSLPTSIFDTSLFKNENEKKNKHINTDDASEVTTKS